MQRPLECTSPTCSWFVTPYQMAIGNVAGLPAASFVREVTPLTSAWSMWALTPSGRSTMLRGQFSLASGSEVVPVDCSAVSDVAGWAAAVAAGNGAGLRENSDRGKEKDKFVRIFIPFFS